MNSSKITLLLNLSSIQVQVSYGQPDTLWTRAYGGYNDDEGYSVQETFDGRLYKILWCH